MGRPRKFDHDEARRLFAEGWPQTTLALHFGVAGPSIRRVIDPEYAERHKQWTREHDYFRQPCIDCGEPATRVFGDSNRAGRCRACFAKAKTKSVRPTTLRCSTCTRWLPDDEFTLARNKPTRRNRCSDCRDCATLNRRAYRMRLSEERREHERKRQAAA